ncbi:hypothetical protein QVA66_04905 [Staphylococcus chromogenes]|nr:hypothetical protein [Staphylococcus chromogenes]
MKIWRLPAQHQQTAFNEPYSAAHDATFLSRPKPTATSASEDIESSALFQRTEKNRLIQVKLTFDSAEATEIIWTHLARKYATGSGSAIVLGQTVIRNLNRTTLEATSSGTNAAEDLDKIINSTIAQVANSFAPDTQVEFTTTVQNQPVL